MSNERAYNFSAGPSMLPLPVIEDVAANLANYKGCGESVMEMSHRSAEFKAILADAEQNLRDIMNIPDNYKVMFIQGGGTLQFAMVPLNLLRKSGKADYVITGTWAKKAAKEAEKFGDIKIVASSEDSTFSYIPKVNREDFRPDADYVHITLNNTIYGTHYPYIPDTGDIPLVADMSSCILSEEIDVTKVRPHLCRRAEKRSAFRYRCCDHERRSHRFCQGERTDLSGLQDPCRQRIHI